MSLKDSLSGPDNVAFFPPLPRTLDSGFHFVAPE